MPHCDHDHDHPDLQALDHRMPDVDRLYDLSEVFNRCNKKMHEYKIRKGAEIWFICKLVSRFYCSVSLLHI